MQFSTSFPNTENPLNPAQWFGGLSDGLQWQNCRSTPNLCFGTQGNAGGFDDSTALLKGSWGPNQDCNATASILTTINDVSEIEIRVRSVITANVNSGYEVLFNVSSSNNYGPQIVKWNGALGSFNVIRDATGGEIHRAVDGDVIRVSIDAVNNIRVFVNGVLDIFFQDTTSPWLTGQPGVGFYTNTGAQDNQYGWKQFNADDGIPSNVLNPAFNLCPGTGVSWRGR